MTEEFENGVEVEINRGLMKRLLTAIDKGITTDAHFIAEKWIDFLEEWGLEMYGKAKQSIVVDDSIVFEPKVQNTDLAPYLIFHEFGSGPSHEPDAHDRYFPPHAVLKAWAEFKGLRWTDRKTGKSLSSDQIARILQFSQYKRGLYPKPSARPAFEIGIAKLPEFIEKELKKEFGRELKSQGSSDV